MTPYYEDAAVALYHGDCRDVLPTLGRFDLLLTDPPYGIGIWSSSGGNSLSASECSDINKWDTRDALEPLGLAISACDLAIVWGGNYFNLGPTRHPLVWDKGIRGMHFADGEMAWTNFNFGTLRIFQMPIYLGDTKGKRQHPTQKPEAVMQWCLSLCKTEPQTVLDPFAGSGTTLVAAKRLGRKAIGIEREERYCEIAARRLSQGALDLFGSGDAA